MNPQHMNTVCTHTNLCVKDTLLAIFLTAVWKVVESCKALFDGVTPRLQLRADEKDSSILKIKVCVVKTETTPA